MTSDGIISTTGFHHVRLTVTDIARSKEFYTRLLGAEPAVDTSASVDEPGVRKDPAQFYGGCVFSFGGQLLGLRPVANEGDTFQSTRVGLDHLSLAVGSRDDLVAAAARLDEAGTPHGDIIDLAPMGLAILSIQDPDDINLELTAPL